MGLLDGMQMIHYVRVDIVTLGFFQILVFFFNVFSLWPRYRVLLRVYTITVVVHFVKIILTLTELKAEC